MSNIFQMFFILRFVCVCICVCAFFFLLLQKKKPKQNTYTKQL